MYYCACHNVHCTVHLQKDEINDDKGSRIPTDNNSRYVHTHGYHSLFLTADHQNLFWEQLRVQFRLKIMKCYCYTYD